MIISGKAAIAAVIGYPVKHTLSPVLHNYWLQQYNIDGAYIPLEVSPENIVEVIKTLPKMGLRGCNITVPHKEAVIAALDEVSDIAKRIGAVNTITVTNEGKLLGTNTDAYGFIQNVKNQVADIDFSAGRAVVIGAGGAARAICAGLQDENVPEIIIVNRTQEKAEAIQTHLGGEIKVVSWKDRESVLSCANFLVNTSILGMQGKPALELNISLLPDNAVVADIVYTPLQTQLLKDAKDNGLKAVSGLGMLLHQAVPGFEFWFGTKPQVTDALYEYILAK